MKFVKLLMNLFKELIMKKILLSFIAFLLCGPSLAVTNDRISTMNSVTFQRWYAGLHEGIFDDGSTPEGSPRVAKIFRKFLLLDSSEQNLYIEYFKYWLKNMSASEIKIIESVDRKENGWRTFFLYTTDHMEDAPGDGHFVDMVAMGISNGRDTSARLFANKATIGFFNIEKNDDVRISAKGEPKRVGLNWWKGFAEFKVLLNKAVVVNYGYNFKHEYSYMDSESSFLAFHRVEYDNYELGKSFDTLGVREAASILDDPRKYFLQISHLMSTSENNEDFEDINKYLSTFAHHYTSCIKLLRR